MGMETSDVADLFEIKLSAPAITVAKAFGLERAVTHAMAQQQAGASDTAGLTPHLAAEILQGHAQGWGSPEMIAHIDGQPALKIALGHAAQGAGAEALEKWWRQMQAPTPVNGQAPAPHASAPQHAMPGPAAPEAAGATQAPKTSASEPLHARVKNAVRSHLGRYELAAIAAGLGLGWAVNASYTVNEPDELRQRMSLEGSWVAEPFQAPRPPQALERPPSTQAPAPTGEGGEAAAE